MILLGPNEPWPIDWIADRETGREHGFDLSLHSIVARGMEKWSWLNGGAVRPRYLLLGKNAKEKLEHETKDIPMYPDLSGEPSKYMGLEITWVDRNGVELL